MREIVLEARAVTRTYGTGTGATHALRGVDVEIEQGRFTAIIGASGCGKSTLLQALGGLDAPTSGKVLLEGQDLYALPDAALARLRRTRLGFVFQAFHLLPEYTVRDNILLPLLLDKREPDEEYLALLTRQLGLTALLQRQPTQLSGGQQAARRHCPGTDHPPCGRAGRRAYRQPGPPEQRGGIPPAAGGSRTAAPDRCVCHPRPGACGAGRPGAADAGWPDRRSIKPALFSLSGCLRMVDLVV